MNKKSWSEEIYKIEQYLSKLSVRDSDGNEMDTDEGFALIKKWTFDIRSGKNVIYFVGNGASAAIASHMAADLAKNALVHTQVFSDLALLTALANDVGYDSVYSEPLRDRGHSGDMLVAISSSGQSENILNAARTARSMDMKVVTFSAMSEANPLRSLGSLNLYVPAEDYGHAETCHAAALHYWMDLASHEEGVIGKSVDDAVKSVALSKHGLLSQ